MPSTQSDDDIDSFVSYLKSNHGLSANTLKAHHADLTACLYLFKLRDATDLNEIAPDDLRSWMAVEPRDRTRSNMARKTVAVRRFFVWAHEHGLATTDPATILMTPSISSTLPVAFTESQVEQLLDIAEHVVATDQYKNDGKVVVAPSSGKAAGKTADKSVDTINRSETPARADKRDNTRVTAESQCNVAIPGLLHTTGVRVAELVSVDIADIDFSNRTTKVTGKGNRQRVVPFGLPAQCALETWLEQGRSILAHTATDTVKSRAASVLFLDARGSRINQCIVRDTVHRAAQEIGVPDISPHTSRHLTATYMLDDSADLREVQEMSGHSSPKTTQRYTYVSIKQLKNRYGQTFPWAWPLYGH